MIWNNVYLRAKFSFALAPGGCGWGTGAEREKERERACADRGRCRIALRPDLHGAKDCSKPLLKVVEIRNVFNLPEHHGH